GLVFRVAGAAQFAQPQLDDRLASACRGNDPGGTVFSLRLELFVPGELAPSPPSPRPHPPRSGRTIEAGSRPLARQDPRRRRSELEPPRTKEAREVQSLDARTAAVDRALNRPKKNLAPIDARLKVHSG